MAGLTTHVLDVTRGGPAERVRVELYEFAAGGERTLIADVATNADGRTDEPLISADRGARRPVRARLSCGRLFSPPGRKNADPPFLDLVPIRFAIADPAAHYHVPLIVSPWSYSTYRGS